MVTEKHQLVLRDTDVTYIEEFDSFQSRLNGFISQWDLMHLYNVLIILSLL